MILPIYAYGQPVLKKVAEPFTQEDKDVPQLVESMWETMYAAHGVGLAGPQVGLSKRIFVVDTLQMDEEGVEPKGIKKVFINAQIINEEGQPWKYEEGCLSIPHLRGDVERQPEIVIRYQDENFKEFEEKYDGVNARVIQHEYDHIEGILFIEKLSPLKRKLIKRKLDNIKSGNVKAEYRLKFVK